MGVTFLLSLIGCIVGFGLGALLAIFRKTESALLIPLRILIVLYTEIFTKETISWYTNCEHTIL